MHLAEFMAKEKLDDQKVAKAIKSTRETISRIRRRKVRPAWGTIAALKKFSRGKITADDFEQVGGAQ